MSLNYCYKWLHLCLYKLFVSLVTAFYDWMHTADLISLRNVAAGFNPLMASFCNIHWIKNNDLYFLLWKEMWLTINLYLVSFTCHLFREEKVVCKNYWYIVFAFYHRLTYSYSRTLPCRYLEQLSLELSALQFWLYSSLSVKNWSIKWNSQYLLS